MSVLKGNNLHDNRVVHNNDNNHGNNGNNASNGNVGSSTQSTGTKQSSPYQANHADKKVQENNATKKALKTGAKGAATALGSPAAGKAVDLVSKTKAGDKVLNKGAEILNRIPGMGKTMKKLDDKKVLDAADKAVDIASANPQNAAGGAAQAGKNVANGADAAQKGAEGAEGSSGLLDKFKPSKPNFLNNDSDKSDDSNGSGKSGSFELSGTILKNPAVKIGLIFFVGSFALILFIVSAAQAGGIFSGYDDAFGVSAATGGETGGVDYSSSDPKAQAFFDRVKDVKNSFQATGKSFNAVYVSAVFSVLNQHGAKLSYDDMTTGVIREIANAMFEGNSFSEDAFKENLVNDIFPKYIPGKDDSIYEAWADDVFDYYDSYYSLIGSTASNCASLGSCVYEIKGFYISRRGNVAQAMTISDLQVRLMECGGKYGSGNWNTPLSGEELVPFEQYVLGVAYQEIGPDAPDEAIKAQMIAARSFSLARPLAMGNANGKKLEQENGQWILQLSSCVADQVYCNPNLGCSAMNDGTQYGTVRSGVDQAVKFKDPLPADHKMRTLANETMGEVLVNEQGNIYYTDYAQSIQDKFKNLANRGLNYKQILLQVYGDSSDIQKMSCNTGSGSGCSSTGSTGPYSGWKQSDPAWGSITIGNTNKTIAGVGCLATSISMLIAKSQVETTVDGDFNPGSFVKRLNQTGGFSGALLNWSAVSNAAPNFKFVQKISVAGQSKTQKLQQIRNLVNQGYYVVVEVKGNTGEHWVAVDSVDGDKVTMMDPGSQATDMWNRYNWSNTSTVAYFRVTS